MSERSEPPRYGGHSAPARTDRHSAPPRTDRHSAPARTDRHSAPPRTDGHSVSPHMDGHGASPRTDRHGASPRTDRHSAAAGDGGRGGPGPDASGCANGRRGGRHLVWDWNGTLLDDLALVVTAANAALRTAGGGPVTAEEHRRDFRRPISEYYGAVLGRPVDPAEFVRLDKIFHEAYAEGLLSCALAAGALGALRSWSGSQSLLSMWFHTDLVPTVDRYGLTRYFARVDGLRAAVGGGAKGPHLAAHLAALGLDGRDCVLIGDSVDDADAAASVGARCVLYTGGFTDPDRLRASGVPVATTLAEAAILAATLSTSP